MRVRTSGVLGLTATMWLLAACTHSMRVPNLRQYALEPTHATRQNVAVLAYEGSDDAEPLFQDAVDSLRAHPSVAQLRTRWSRDDVEPDFAPDVVLRITPSVEYKGSGWNLPITFPGFLVFTHAWNGYVYSADVHTEVEVIDPRSDDVVKRLDVPTAYSMRHTSAARGFWSGSGWWMPGWGATALLSGLFFISYSDSATEPFLEEVRRPYGEYIAEVAMRPALELARQRRSAETAAVTGAAR